MPISSGITIEAGPGDTEPWVPPERRGSKLRQSGVGLTHSYTTDAQLFSESDWVYLQVVLSAYQIHPATVAELSALGPVGSTNAMRWTIEGPTSHRIGDPGFGVNCTMLVEVAHSLTSDPGTDWRVYRPERYKLRSFKARLTVVRPDVTYGFRVTRFAVRATRVAPAQRDVIGERFFSHA